MFQHLIRQFSFSLIFITLLFSSNSYAQVTAERVLPSAMYVPGVTIPVKIKIWGEPGPLMIQENPPAGWTISRISHLGTFEQGVISWNLPIFMGFELIQYQATPPAETQEEALFSGNVNEQAITGMTVLEPAELTAERTLPAQGYLPDQSIIVEIFVQSPPGEYVITETPPTGWTVWRISHKGQFENGVIRWTPSVTGTSPLALTYWLTVPTDALGTHEFTGTFNDRPITGHSNLEPHIPEPLGIFSDHIDFIGKGQPLGSAVYNPTTEEYEIIGGELQSFDITNLCGHIAYKYIRGDVTFKAKVRPIRLNHSNTFTGAIMGFFDSLSQGSKCFLEKTYVNEIRVEAIWRTVEMKMLSYHFWTFGQEPYRDSVYEVMVVREKDQCTSYFRNVTSEEWTLHQTQTMGFEDPIIVMLAVWPINNNVLCKGIFSEVELIESLPSTIQDWALF